MGRIGGIGDLAAAEYGCRENEDCNVCLCHNQCEGLFAATSALVQHFHRIAFVQHALHHHRAVDTGHAIVSLGHFL